LRELNISHLQFSKENIKTFTSCLLDLFNKDWNLNNNLKKLFWDGDLAVDKPLALEFMTKSLPKVYNLRLRTIFVCDVFSKIE
jgi:hypothetical protein